MIHVGKMCVLCVYKRRMIQLIAMDSERHYTNTAVKEDEGVCACT